MPTRTITATGKITNTGSVQATFVANLRVQGADKAGNPLPARAWSSLAQVLAPGAISAPISITGSPLLAGGDNINIWVDLDITSPILTSDVARTAKLNYTEPSVVSGSLDFGTPTVTRLSGNRNVQGAFQIEMEDAVPLQFGVDLSAVPVLMLAAGLAIVGIGWAVSRRRG